MTQETLMAIKSHDRQQRREDWIALSHATKNVIWTSSLAYVLVYLVQWLPGFMSQLLEIFQ